MVWLMGCLMDVQMSTWTGSSDQMRSSNGAVEMFSLEGVVSMSHAKLSKSVDNCSVLGLGVW